MHNMTQPSNHSQWMAYSQPGGVDSHVSLVKVSAIAIETCNEVTGGVLYFIYETNQYISSVGETDPGRSAVFTHARKSRAAVETTLQAATPTLS
jgi:hypothetical protein